MAKEYIVYQTTHLSYPDIKKARKHLRPNYPSIKMYVDSDKCVLMIDNVRGWEKTLDQVVSELHQLGLDFTLLPKI